MKQIKTVPNEILENPKKALLIAYKNGGTISDEELQDIKSLQHAGRATGEINRQIPGEISMPHEVIENICFWASHKKVDTNTRSAVIEESYFKPTVS